MNKTNPQVSAQTDTDNDDQVVGRLVSRRALALLGVASTAAISGGLLASQNSQAQQLFFATFDVGMNLR